MMSMAQYKRLMAAPKKAIKKDSKSKKASVTIGCITFFARSPWEANIAAYFENEKRKGKIRTWEHEPDTFWFEMIRRGVRSYLPDFKITRIDESFYYVEVKGYMDAKSKTKIKRMAKYYPSIELQLIDEKGYRQIKKNANKIPEWGIMDNV